MSLKSKDKFFYVITVDGSTRSDEARQESVRRPIITGDTPIEGIDLSPLIGRLVQKKLR